MNTSAGDKNWVNEIVENFKHSLLLATEGKFKDYSGLENLIIDSYKRATSEFGFGEEWILMEPLDDLLVEIVNDSENNQSIGKHPLIDAKIIELIVNVSKNTDWSMWEFYAALNPSIPLKLLEELAESTFAWEENSTKEAVANNPSSPEFLKKKLSTYVHPDLKDLQEKNSTSSLKTEPNSSAYISSTKGLESKLIDYAKDFSSAATLIDQDLTDKDELEGDLEKLYNSYSKMLSMEMDIPSFGSYVWRPQMYKLPMDENREVFDANSDVHLIENYSKKILVRSEDLDIADSINYEQSNFWRIVLIRTGEKFEYSASEDLALLKDQISKASQVFELSEKFFSAAIKWIRFEEVETVIGNLDLLPN